jgi:hypothetical protein
MTLRSAKPAVLRVGLCLASNNTAAVDAVINLGTTVHGGALSVGGAIGLEQNTAPKIELDLYDLSGDPATPLIPGKQAKYAAQKLAVKAANEAARAAAHDGREYCRLAIGVLKPVLGNRWNTQWNAAGFVAPSLALFSAGHLGSRGAELRERAWRTGY